MISVKDQDRLIREIVDGLLHPEHPAHFDVVAPPGFASVDLVSEFSNGLRSHASRPLLAILSMDEITGDQEFVEALHREWSMAVPLPKPDLNQSDSGLGRLLAAVPNGRPAVYVLRRFHKIRETISNGLLGLLRSSEQAYQARALTITPLPLWELKRRWERKGHALTVSDYGDTHVPRLLEPLPPDQIRAWAVERNVPRHIVDFALELTGGYPEPFREVIACAQRRGSQNLNRVFRNELCERAEQCLQPLIKWLDREEESRYRDEIINLHQGFEPDAALDILREHPWRILTADDGLRASALGRAALSFERDNHRKKHSVLARAQQHYRRRDFTQALRMLDDLDSQRGSLEVLILRAHSEIMAALFSESEPGVDSDWGKMRLALTGARKILSVNRRSIPDAELIEHHYKTLEECADTMLKARGEIRIVDYLAAPAADGSYEESRVKAALLLLTLQVENAREHRARSLALSAVLAVPEQIFRIWARWRLGINYDSAPEIPNDLWQKVVVSWESFSKGQESLRPPETGKRFDSFWQFAWICLTWFLERADQPTLGAPEESLAELGKALQLHHQLRTPPAHAVVQIDGRERKRYFDLIDRWNRSLYSVCPHRHLTREQILAAVTPLPLIDSNGNLLFS